MNRREGWPDRRQVGEVGLGPGKTAGGTVLTQRFTQSQKPKRAMFKDTQELRQE